MNDFAAEPISIANEPMRDRFHPILLWLLLTLFFVTSLAVLPLLSLHRGDERFYTDAAIRMVKTGDWITPYYADGEMRFRKPILPYWIVAVPFELFGIGVASSRIGSLIAATVTLALTYRLAMILMRDGRIALVTTAVMASNENFLSLAARATTDSLQTCCATLAILGLAGMFFERPSKSFAAGFWIGTGLLAATKGGLAIVMLAFGVSMVLWRGRRLGVALRDMIHWPSIIVGTFFAFGWFAAVLAKHGTVAWNDFWNDQVGGRMDGGWLMPVENFVVYVASFAVEFLPWSILIVVAGLWQWRQVRAFFNEHREVVIFAAAWLVVLLAVFSPANIQRTRYLMPSYPLVALLGSALLLRFWDDEAAGRRVRRMIAILVLGAVVGALVQLATGWRFDALLSIAGAVSFLVAAAALLLPWPWRSGSRPAWEQAVVFSVFVLLLIRVNDGLISPATLPPSGPLLTAAIREHASPTAKIAAVGVAPGQLAQIRLLTGGTRDVTRLAEDASDHDLSQYDVLLLAHTHGHTHHEPHGFIVEPIGRVALSWHLDDVVAIGFGRKDKEEILTKRSIAYAIARRDHSSATHATIPSTSPSPKSDRTMDEE